MRATWSDASDALRLAEQTGIAGHQQFWYVLYPAVSLALLAWHALTAGSSRRSGWAGRLVMRLDRGRGYGGSQSPGARWRLTVQAPPFAPYDYMVDKASKETGTGWIVCVPGICTVFICCPSVFL